MSGLGAVGEPGQSLTVTGKAGHPFGEGLQVLVGEQRGGHQNRNPFAVLYRLNAARTAISVLP